MDSLVKRQPTKIVWRAIIFLLVSVTPFSNLFAGRAQLYFGAILSNDMTIVLATINDVAEVDSPNVDSLNNKISGFRFRLDFEEIIRLGQMQPDVRKFDVAFSSSGYGTNWEFGAKPTNGMKVMAHLKKLKSGEFELHNHPGGVLVLEDFKQPVVEQTREICDLWKIDDPAQQLERVIAGYRGDTLIQSYCSKVLGDLDGTWTGLNLEGEIDQRLADSILFEPFASKTPVSLSRFGSLEYKFWNEFRGKGWELYEPRYDLLSRSIDKMIAEAQPAHHNTFDAMITRLCSYPSHSQENYQRMMKVIDGKLDILKFGTTIRLSMIYRAHTSDPKMESLNEEIFDSLLAMISDNGDLADGAAIAIGNIAVSYAGVGPVPEKFMKLIQCETDFEISNRVRARMGSALREVRAAKPPKLDADVAVLSYPWDSLIGKKVFVSAVSCYNDGQHGASADFRSQRLWLDGIDDWPDEVGGGSAVQLTGRLTKVTDLPVFRYEIGKPLGDGLPVPEGYSLRKASTRYVLLEPSWKIIEK